MAGSTARVTGWLPNSWAKPLRESRAPSLRISPPNLDVEMGAGRRFRQAAPIGRAQFIGPDARGHLGDAGGIRRMACRGVARQALKVGAGGTATEAPPARLRTHAEGLMPVSRMKARENAGWLP